MEDKEKVRERVKKYREKKKMEAMGVTPDNIQEKVIEQQVVTPQVIPEYIPEWDENKVEAGNNRVLKMGEMVMGGDAYYKKVHAWAQHLHLLCTPDYRRPKCLIKSDKKFKAIREEIENMEVRNGN